MVSINVFIFGVFSHYAKTAQHVLKLWLSVRSVGLRVRWLIIFISCLGSIPPRSLFSSRNL